MQNQNESKKDTKTASDFIKNINLEKFCLQQYLSSERVFGNQSQSKEFDHEKKLKFGL